MAITTVWSVDLGKSALKAVKLRRDRDNVEIVAVDKVDYPLSTNGVDASGQAKEALESFCHRQNVKEPVVVAHPGQGTFSRFIKVPAFDTKKVNEMVGYEASQQIPFPLDEVVWGFHVVERDYLPGEEREVALFAVRREAMDDFLLEFAQRDLAVQTVSIGYLGLVNFVTHDIAPEEPSIILDIGATHTDLVLLDGKRFWVRPIPHSGNDVTKAIMQRFKIGFPEAEQLKIDTSKVPQKAVKIFQAVIQPKLKELVGEIHRSIGFYRSQAGEVNFRKLYLLGNGSKIIGIKKFLEESLNLEVVKVQTINHFRVGRQVNLKLLQNELPSFATSLGCGLQALELGSCKVDLVPQEEKVQREFNKKKKHVFIAAAVVLAATVAVHFLISARLTNVKRALSAATEVTRKLDDGDTKRKELILGGQPRYQRLVDRVKEIAEVRGLALKMLQSLEAALAALPLVDRPELVVPKGGVDREQQASREYRDTALLKRVWVPWLELAATTYPPEAEPHRSGPRGRKDKAPTVPAVSLRVFVVVKARDNDADSAEFIKKSFREPFETELRARKIELLPPAGPAGGAEGTQDRIKLATGRILQEIYYDPELAGAALDSPQEGSPFYGAEVSLIAAERRPPEPQPAEGEAREGKAAESKPAEEGN
jgi:type IV pilus assembly protein PilM